MTEDERAQIASIVRDEVKALLESDHAAIKQVAEDAAESVIVRKLKAIGIDLDDQIRVQKLMGLLDWLYDLKETTQKRIVTTVLVAMLGIVGAALAVAFKHWSGQPPTS